MNKYIKGGAIAALLLLLGTWAAKAFKKSEITKISNTMKSYDDELDVNTYNSKYKKVMGDSATRRNCNPGALFWFGDKWQGMNEKATIMGKMIVFNDFKSGARAQAITLLNYYRKHGLKNITHIMNRYAPATENNTKAYINWLSQRLGVAADVDLNFVNNRQTLAKLCYFIHIYEAGFAWLAYDIFVEQALNAK